ncbi:alpha/beta fold hydrolase [Variovorax ginsengisoli]|uniref:Pimeloyl-ACP methyl ester carboxylesterase n=1 Tax=Variovorax ginsengisoli TaxID=363844 RepID=A0ABT9S4D8_9BURK|nr:alpha/beta hydrolase [Variovorax ginsengisoli]MDP9899219.1 pimeloyl-ACP methyl ester carboxylesterase [Variovorax ginsengisoli]
MPIAHLNGQDLYFEDSGGDGPAVIFSHGLLMDSSMFEPQVAALKSRYRCIVWDERGHGRTATDTCTPFTYYDSANDLAALLAHLGVQRAVLAGMSQGGYLSLRCALTHPALVRALILIDTQAMLEDPAQMPHHQALVEDWVTNGLSDANAQVIEHIILGDGWPGAAPWHTKWKQTLPVNLLQCFTTLAARDDISDRVPEIAVPALVVHGESDQAIDLSRAMAMANALPNAHVVTVPGAGHAANLTHPTAVNPAIEKFLASLDRE